jgi:hypothetical protein
MVKRSEPLHEGKKNALEIGNGYRKPQKKESNRYPGNKKSLKSNKKHSGSPLQKIRTSGRQNPRA